MAEDKTYRITATESDNHRERDIVRTIQAQSVEDAITKLFDLGPPVQVIDSSKFFVAFKDITLCERLATTPVPPDWTYESKEQFRTSKGYVFDGLYKNNSQQSHYSSIHAQEIVDMEADLRAFQSFQVSLVLRFRTSPAVDEKDVENSVTEALENWPTFPDAVLEDLQELDDVVEAIGWSFEVKRKY